jgi:hypothetical protein
MEQSEKPETPGPNPPPPRVELPDPQGALGIPDQYRLPLHGKMVTPTAAPSAAERTRNLEMLRRRRRRRGFLVGLLAGQLLILALDYGGTWLLRTHPQVKLQAPVGVPAIVFLGMAIGAAAMLALLALIFAFLGLRALFGPRRTGLATAIGRGIGRVFLTTVTLGLTMGVILGTAWFMIPGPEWTATRDFAREQGRKAAEAARGQFKVLGRPAPGSP